MACAIKHPDVQANTSAFDLQNRGKAAIFELPFNFPVYFTPEALGNVKGFKCPSLPRVFLPVPLIYRFDFQLERGKGRNSEKGWGSNTITEELKESRNGNGIKHPLPAAWMKNEDLLETM